MNDQPENTYPCSECQAGVMHAKFLTYFTWLDEELVTVPNFPAWVCDVCGRREYDARAISLLATMLNPETGKAAAARRRVQPRPEKRDRPRPSPE
jgi:YgiT-type zinc finger domain-containing protein